MIRLVALVFLAACSFDPTGVELDLDEPADAAPAVDDATRGDVDAAVASPDAGEPAPDADEAAPDARQDQECGDVGESCCEEQPICKGLSVCINDTCVL